MKDIIPSKLATSRSNLPWMTTKLRRIIKKKHKLYQKAKKSKKDHDWAVYKKHKSSSQKAMRNAQWDYINNVIETAMQDNNVKPFWRYIKSRKQDNIGVSPIKNMGQLHSDSKSKAELLNHLFCSVFTQDSSDKLPEVAGNQFPSIGPLNITVSGVTKLLTSLKVNKASGPDALPNRILKETAVEIAPAITAIFQQSIATSNLPQDWKNANVSPVFKKGSRHEAVNYRPVSLTCVLCKLLEHIICKHILDHLESYNILTSFQHGFRSGHSCESQLIITLHDLMNNYDRKVQTDVAILDFSKAFDTVPHKRLLHKLNHYGITGKINSWIASFLLDRNQCVVVDGESSSSARVVSGVPQGTVLGPLLFLCFINDLPDQVKSRVRLFADDCLLYCAIRNIQDQIDLQKDLKALEQWAETWGMRLNAQKCYNLRIARARKPLEHMYDLCGHVLKQVPHSPYLGVIISEDLKWSDHINKITAKANSTLGFLRRNLKKCPLKIKQQSFCSLVRSMVEYSCSVWDPHLEKDIHNIEMIQRRGARFVAQNYGRQSSVHNMLNDLNWSPLELRRREARLTMFYKIINDLIAIPAEDYVTQLSSRTCAGASGNNFRPITSNTNVSANSFFPRTVKDWNNLPDSIKSAVTINQFKSELANQRQ